ncbi:hypothetical protein ITJ54_05815 [Curtobacterium sp. VKM Ac-2865]|uniref:hypothetical protein n=1 Tax=Curtobacterium sp. VKM Ac-2865 TaxID=2783817 RepID=UPI00188B8D0F|nr:hypothetical protein [Curtobacterium sp. VKM Ac-2865]MBF4582183.1 hypothetical protein [Curtobacterium sp. VKM Ac-2865]
MGEVPRTTRRLRIVVSMLCCSVALVMVLGQVVPALRPAQGVVWGVAAVVSVVALVTVLAAGRRRGAGR